MTPQVTDQIQTFSKTDLLNDYRLANESRQASLMGRKEVFMGKAKFGIFGDGKELAQIAMAKVFKKGDFRSGYYRDQTFMMAIGQLTIEAFFAQLYAHPDEEADPSSAGRCMNAHFSTRSLNPDGSWKTLTEMKNSSADVSCTAAQMPRLVGLAYASKLYRQNPDLHSLTQFSQKGNEIAFGTIGNASSAEGHFFESINAAGVLKIPMLTAVWDDDYGISVPNKYQITKEDISAILSGLQRESAEDDGYEIFRVKGWDYPALVETFEKAAGICRADHVPVLVHVKEMTQPQGHSTSGSHERYKSKERLAWEEEFDCIRQFKQWLLENNYAQAEDLEQIEANALERVKQARKNAWDAFLNSIKDDSLEALRLIEKAAKAFPAKPQLKTLHQELKKALNPTRLDAVKTVKKSAWLLRDEQSPIRAEMAEWLKKQRGENHERYSSHLYSESEESALKVTSEPVAYDAKSRRVDGREIMQACFDAALARDPRIFAIGEDVGKIGDVNQGFAGLQDKYGDLRVTDTGIREATILGQGIGAAMRGLRPIVEIQYLDYIFYALQLMSDDLATLRYRTKGGQKAPLIIRSRGHRLEGIWHSGSPIAAILNAVRGIYLLVPRNMTQAAGFYNTMLEADDPALIIECLNGYRLKEVMPKNIATFKVPLGMPETIREGEDITVVTYGSMCRIVMEAAEMLSEVGIDLEVIDAQTLLPFDLEHRIVKSIKKTNRVIFTDEDVPGGGTAYMMQQVIDKQNAYRWLDSKPVCISANAHRPAYANDGDYFSKPNTEDLFEAAYAIMREADPARFPELYG